MDFDYKCLYVRGLNPKSTAEELKPVFEDAGNVCSIKKVSPVTAIVGYMQEEDARWALECLDGSNIRGNVIHIEYKTRRNDNTWNRGATRNNYAQARNSNVSSELSEKLDIDLHKLRYMSAFHNTRNFLNSLQANITIDLDSASLSITGDQFHIAEAIREVEKLMSSFSVVTFPLSDVFRQCFRPVHRAEIVEKFKSSQIFAGWDLSENQLRICSNCIQNANLALELIKDLVVESEYPVNGELSSSKQAMVAGSDWVHFRDQLKADDTTGSLEIQYDNSAKRVRFALRSNGNRHAVVLALDQFFGPVDIREQVVTFDKTLAQLILKRQNYISNHCSEDGIEFDFGKLSKSNCCIVKSESTKSLDSAVCKLKHLATNVKRKSTSFFKSSHVAWLKSTLGKEKLADVDLLSHTISKTAISQVMHTTLEALPTTYSKPPSAGPASRLTGKIKIVRGDLANIEADGLVSCDGVVARAIETQLNGVKLKPGIQVVLKLVGGKWSKVYVYHIQTVRLDSVEDAMKQLALKVKHAYQTLQANKTKIIAFPAIGTGGRGYPPANVASTLVGIAAEHFDADSTQKVYFVIHPQADDLICMAFVKELRKQLMSLALLSPPPPPPKPKATAELTVTFTGLLANDVTEAVGRLEKELKHIVITQSWDLPTDKAAIKKLKILEVSKIRSKAEDQNVDAGVDVSSGTIKLEGLKDDIVAVRDYVNSILGSKASSTNAFPEHWDEAALAKGHHEVKLDPYSTEYSVVLCKFFESCTITGIKVTEITRIQNEHLYTQYQAQKSKVKKELVGDPSVEVERELWHGTTAESVKQICANEFNRSYAGAHGMAYGQGSYFSTTTQYSIKFSEGQQDKYVILAKVGTGRYRLGNSDTTRKNLPAGYHSTVNSQSKPSIFVVYHDAAAYPEYVIQFRKEMVTPKPAVVSSPRGFPGQSSAAKNAVRHGAMFPVGLGHNRPAAGIRLSRGIPRQPSSSDNAARYDAMLAAGPGHNISAAGISHSRGIPTQPSSSDSAARHGAMVAAGPGHNISTVGISRSRRISIHPPSSDSAARHGAMVVSKKISRQPSSSENAAHEDATSTDDQQPGVFRTKAKPPRMESMSKTRLDLRRVGRINDEDYEDYEDYDLFY